jgi:hypothetical protein
MTTKTLTMTIPELCAKLGKEYHDDNDTFILSDIDGLWECDYKGGQTAILSVGQQIPSDECRVCGCKTRASLHERFTPPRCACEGKYPLLLTVLGIKLVERCEKCKAKYDVVDWLDENGKTVYGCYTCAKTAKPMQMVEITTEKKED